MSVSPRQNFLKPPPVPEMPTVTRMAPRLSFWNSSATASVIGKTVLEPSILTIFGSAEAVPVTSRRAARVGARILLSRIMCSSLLVFVIFSLDCCRQL